MRCAAIVLLLVALPAYAASVPDAQPTHTVLPSDALKVQAHFAKIPLPLRGADPFTHFIYNTAGLHTVHCMSKAGLTPDAKLFEAGFTDAGSWTMPRQEEEAPLCASLAKDGFYTDCFGIRAWVTDGPKDPWPSIYLQTYKDQKDIQLWGSVQCFMDKAQTQVQDFQGTLIGQWIEAPADTSITTAKGAKNVLSGTIIVRDTHAKRATGEPLQMPMRVIVKE